MTRVFTTTLACAIGLGVSATAGAQKPDTATKTKKTTKVATAPRVLSFKPAAIPKLHNGKCPVTIKFQSYVHLNRAGTIEYQWERSDGATGPKQSMAIGGNKQYVFDTWELGAAGDHTTVWERVHVLSPNDMTSGKATARVNCTK